MKKPASFINTIVGNREQMEPDRYFITVTCLVASIFLFVLCAIHLIMNFSYKPVLFAGGSSLVMLGLYYFIRFKRCLFWPKVILTFFGLIMLDFTWYAKFLSNGPVLFFILIFGALVIWVWEGKSLIIMLSFYALNILVLFIIDYNAPEYLFNYPDDRKRSVDIFLSFILYATLMIFLLYVVKQEFTRQKEKAIRSDKLKSAFLANMSHEIRTPMNAIVGFSRLLQMDITNDNKNKYSRIIQSSSDNLLRLINDIIDLSKIEAGDMEIKYADLNLKDVFTELMDMYKIELAKREKQDITLDFTLPGKDLFIHSDALRLKQVLINLLDNAIKYTDQGKILFAVEKKDKKLVFSVKDTGSGIKAEDQKRIFDQFTKVDYHDLNIGGTGIGLSIVVRIVEMLKGEIWLNSLEGEGSHFYFAIPYLPPTGNLAEILKSKEIKSSVSNGNAKTVMVVEDDESSFLLLEALLYMLEVNFHHVTNGKEAIQYVLENPDIRLILMDIKLPIMDGYEVTREIKKLNPGIIVIAQTAYAMMGDEEKAYSAGCDEYLTKPLNLNKLQDLIAKYLVH